MDDGDVAIQRDGHQEEGGQVEAEGPEEHADPAGDVPGIPGHGGVPDGLQRHEDEGHDQVCDGQVHNEDVDAGFKPLGPEEGDEDGEVAGGGHDEETRVGDDGHEGVLRERHLLGQEPAGGAVAPTQHRARVHLSRKSFHDYFLEYALVEVFGGVPLHRLPQA